MTEKEKEMEQYQLNRLIELTEEKLEALRFSAETLASKHDDVFYIGSSYDLKVSFPISNEDGLPLCKKAIERLERELAAYKTELEELGV